MTKKRDYDTHTHAFIYTHRQKNEENEKEEEANNSASATSSFAMMHHWFAMYYRVLCAFWFYVNIHKSKRILFIVSWITYNNI